MRTRAEIAPAMGGRRTWVAMRSPWSRNVLQRAIPRRFRGFILMDQRQCCSLDRSNVGVAALLVAEARVSQNGTAGLEPAVEPQRLASLAIVNPTASGGIYATTAPSAMASFVPISVPSMRSEERRVGKECRS